jgi:hypothetical protein
MSDDKNSDEEMTEDQKRAASKELLLRAIKTRTRI